MNSNPPFFSHDHPAGTVINSLPVEYNAFATWPQVFEQCVSQGKSLCCCMVNLPTSLTLRHLNIGFQSIRGLAHGVLVYALNKLSFSKNL
jgi:hypothetical protein